MGGTDMRFARLRDSIPEGQVLEPGSEAYDKSLKRWSETCIKPAVRCDHSHPLPMIAVLILQNRQSL